MNAIILFGGLIVALIVGGIIFALSLTSRGKNTSAQTIEGTDFIPSQMFMGKDNLGGLAVNEHTHQICLFTEPSAPPRLLRLTDLIGSYLIKNGEVLGEGKRSYPEEIEGLILQADQLAQFQLEATPEKEMAEAAP
jgi:hypothetical protein